MAEGLQVARLIPTSGISNQAEAETRATSALLAVLTIVRDLSMSLLVPLGASTARKATVEAFIEVRFKLGDGTVVRPDGLIQVTYGASTWKAFVEVKTGENDLEADQINNYLQLAREQGIDAVLTISNEIAAGNQHPCEGVKVRANSKVRLAHYSWTEILAHAVRAKVHRGVDDPEQAWILGELIRYLEHPASGAMSFSDMGAHWVAVRDAAREGTLRRTDDAVRDIATRWDQLLRYTALRHRRRGPAHRAQSPRRPEDPPELPARLTDVDRHPRRRHPRPGRRREPDRAGRPAGATRLGVRGCPRTQRPRHEARITWLVRQLGPDTPSNTIVEAWGRNARQPIVATVGELRSDRDLLVDPDKRELVRFRLMQRAEMGQNRKDGGRSPGFIESVTNLATDFYATTLQQILPWTARAPQARTAPRQSEVIDKPIEDADELDEAIDAARSAAADETFEPDPDPAAGIADRDAHGDPSEPRVGEPVTLPEDDFVDALVPLDPPSVEGNEDHDAKAASEPEHGPLLD